MTFLTLLTALMPILAIFVFLVLLRLPAVRAMPIGLALTAITAWQFWKVPPVHLAAAASVVDLTGREGSIIRYTMIPMLFFIAMAGAMAMITGYFLK